MSDLSTLDSAYVCFRKEGTRGKEDKEDMENKEDKGTAYFKVIGRCIQVTITSRGRRGRGGDIVWITSPFIHFLLVPHLLFNI